MEIDWQNNLTKIKERNQYILKSEKLADCRFLVGTASNQSLIAGHRLLLAIASPVFERMFYGHLPEMNDPIVIPDVQPNAFAAMLDYIYTDEISISSFDNACDLYYVAKKYMLPHVVDRCTNFFLSNLTSKNACRVYEFAELYEDQQLLETSMEHIATNTRQVLADPSFMDIKVSTLMTILDQNRLNIDSELDLFNCLLKFANELGILNDEENDADSENESNVAKIMRFEPENSGSEAASASAGTCGNIPNVADEVVEVERKASSPENASESAANIIDAHHNRMDEAMLRMAVKKIRFLAMTPQQFTEGPARSKLLKQNEAFTILIRISNPTITDCPMPEGFCELGKRDRGGSDQENRYCICASNRFSYNSSKTDSSLTFKVDTNIHLLGVRIQLPYPYLGNYSVIACVQNMQGSVIQSSGPMKYIIDSRYEFTFASPIFINRDQYYIIKIINQSGDDILMYSWDPDILCRGVNFSIAVLPRIIDFGSAIYCIFFSQITTTSQET